MIRFIINRPIAVIISFISLFFLGIVAYYKLPISLLPTSEVPELIIKYKTENLPINESEAKITSVLRNNLIHLNGLEKIESKTFSGGGQINLRFDYSRNINLASIEVNEKLDQTMHLLPRTIRRPSIIKKDVNDIAVFSVDIFSSNSENSFSEISQLATEVLQKRFEQLPEVAMADMTGVSTAEIKISPKTEIFQELGANSFMIFDALNSYQYESSALKIKDGHFNFILKFNNNINDLDQLKHIPITINNREFKLSDLADVLYSNDESNGAYYSNENQAINFAIIKQKKSRVEDLNKNFNFLIESLKKEYPQLTFKIYRDQTKILNYAIDNLKQDLLIGGLLAFILLLIFIRRLKMALIIGVSVPLSLSLTQIVFYLNGLSLNIISLGGLILGLSMIIDSTIVVIDAISNYCEEGLNVKEAAIKGASEVSSPLLASLLSNCAVFIPLLFFSGIGQAIFKDQALSIIIGVVVSILVSLIFIPTFFCILYKKYTPNVKNSNSILNFIIYYYDKILGFCFKYKFFPTILIVIISIIAYIVLIKIEKDRLPKFTKTDFEITFNWNQPVTKEENLIRTKEILRELQSNKEILSIHSWVGQQQYLLQTNNNISLNEAKFYILVKNKDHIQPIINKTIKSVRTHYPLVVTNHNLAMNAFDYVFSSGNPDLRILFSKINGIPEVSTITNIITLLKQKLPSIDINPIIFEKQISIGFNHEIINRFDLNVKDIRKRIEEVLIPLSIEQFKISEDNIRIVIYNNKVSLFEEILNSTTIKNKYNADLPLNSFINVEEKIVFSEIFSGKTNLFYPIEIKATQPQKIIQELKNILEPYKNLNISLDGEYFENQEMLYQMLNILILSILLLYCILAAQFESLTLPALVLIEIPIAIIGALLFLYLGNESINLMSMIGIVVMCGLIINDSILKIDAINKYRKEGIDLKEAIYKGGHERIRPIIMITLTTIGSLSPVLFMNDIGSELQKPLSLTLIGGMIIGLNISLFYLPILYYTLFKNKY